MITEVWPKGHYYGEVFDCDLCGATDKRDLAAIALFGDTRQKFISSDICPRCVDDGQERMAQRIRDHADDLGIDAESVAGFTEWATLEDLARVVAEGKARRIYPHDTDESINIAPYIQDNVKKITVALEERAQTLRERYPVD